MWRTACCGHSGVGSGLGRGAAERAKENTAALEIVYTTGAWRWLLPFDVVVFVSFWSVLSVISFCPRLSFVFQSIRGMWALIYVPRVRSCCRRCCCPTVSSGGRISTRFPSWRRWWHVLSECRVSFRAVDVEHRNLLACGGPLLIDSIPVLDDRAVVAAPHFGSRALSFLFVFFPSDVNT